MKGFSTLNAFRFLRKTPSPEPIPAERPAWSSNLTWLSGLDSETFVGLAYNVLLRREPDEAGLKHYSRRLEAGELRAESVLSALIDSEEFRQSVLFNDLGSSIHASRMQFVKSLPKASRILDLGGASMSSNWGAFVNLGYPYKFTELVVVDLPSSERHPLYVSAEERYVVPSPLGPVRYVYRSMSDLSEFADGSFDLVYSGQSIEHVSESEGTTVIDEAYRVLRPGGHFCLDTPNARATRMQQEAFVDPDHKIEYSHEALSAKIRAVGLEIKQAKGLNYLGACLDTGEFSESVVAFNFGMFDAISDCYILTYVCQKPTSSSESAH